MREYFQTTKMQVKLSRYINEKKIHKECFTSNESITCDMLRFGNFFLSLGKIDVYSKGIACCIDCIPVF